MQACQNIGQSLRKQYNTLKRSSCAKRNAEQLGKTGRILCEVLYVRWRLDIKNDLCGHVHCQRLLASELKIALAPAEEKHTVAISTMNKIKITTEVQLKFKVFEPSSKISRNFFFLSTPSTKPSKLFSKRHWSALFTGCVAKHLDRS